MRGAIIQINISPGGLPKLPVHWAEVRTLGLSADDQRNKQYHGGPEQAILIVASEVIDQLRAEGFGVFYGALGENLTTWGIDHASWRAGQRFQAGTAIVQLTKRRAPCASLNPYGRGIQKRVFDSLAKANNPDSPVWGMSGFYACVAQEGSVHTGDIIHLLDPVVQQG
jgi:MOSC domain-containing protein YiiM